MILIDRVTESGLIAPWLSHGIMEGFRTFRQSSGLAIVFRISQRTFSFHARRLQNSLAQLDDNLSQPFIAY